MPQTPSAGSGFDPGATTAAPPAPSLLDQYPYTGPPTGKLCRVFLSHAGEQKRELVDVIHEAFEQRYPALKGKVFLDERSLEGGQRAPVDHIYKCLRDAFVVIVVLSEDFIAKRYPMEELQLLMHWQQQGSPVKVLPVLYHITYDEVQKVVEHYEAVIAASTGEGQQQLPPLPQHLSRVKQAVEDLVREGEQQKLQQQVKDLKQLLNITVFRQDQAPWSTDMRDLVVGHTVKLLRDMGQMPTPAMQNLPDVTVDLDHQVERVVQCLEDGSQLRSPVQYVTPTPSPAPSGCTAEYKVVSGDTLDQIAKSLQVTRQRIMDVNPQITDPDQINVGDIIRIPPCTSIPKPQAPSARCGKKYTIKKGDFLFKIANENNITVADLLAANPKFTDQNLILAGDTIIIPQPCKGRKPLPTSKTCTIRYTIKHGDTLTKIAGANGVTVQDLLASNPEIKNPGRIAVGDTLIIRKPC